jgi:hypothetical protein
MSFDPDQVDPSYGEVLARYFDTSLARLRDQILHPAGMTAEAQQWNAQRAIAQYNRVAAELRGLKRQVADWTGKAISSGATNGVVSAGKQIQELKDAGWEPPKRLTAEISGAFGGADIEPVKVLALDTYQDLAKAIDSTGARIQQTLHSMAGNGLTVDEVNQCLANGFVEGKPALAIKQLQRSSSSFTARS